MERNIHIGILTESGALGAAIERALKEDGRFEVCRLDLERDDLRAPDDLDVLLASSGLPRGEALRLLGRSWMSHRFPRILFLHGRKPGPGATLTRHCASELADLAEAAARRRGAIPSRVTLRFLEPGAGGAEAMAAGG